MALRLLGDAPIDIHAGGVDLVFPHHENEIAQAEGATGQPFARFWVHVESLAHRPCHQDVEVARQRVHRARNTRPGVPSIRAALRAHLDALPQAAAVHVGQPVAG